MATTQRSTVVGVFENRDQADRAVQELKRAGFRDDQIGYVHHRGDRTGTTGSDADESHAGEGAAAGAIGGAALGGLAGAIAAGLIPGIGPFIAAGILAATATGVAAGAAAGGVLGALVGLGIPEDEAQYYEGEFKSGRLLVTVRADGRYDEAWTIMQRHGAYNKSTGRTSTAASGFAATSGTAHTTTAAGGQTIKVHEEELHARKQPVQTGEVRVHKEVVTEHKTLNVPVQKEEVVIERRPVSGTASSSDIRAGEEIRIPVKEEQVRVEKTPVVKEEVHIGKRQVQETEQVSGTVRKEEVRIEQEGDVDVRGSGASDTKNPGRGRGNKGK